MPASGSLSVHYLFDAHRDPVGLVLRPVWSAGSRQPICSAKATMMPAGP
jgi:hypothetical protein